MIKLPLMHYAICGSLKQPIILLISELRDECTDHLLANPGTPSIPSSFDP